MLMFEHNKKNIDKIVALKDKLGPKFPKIAIFVVLYNGKRHLAKVLKRIHPKVMEIIEEIYVIDDCSEDNGFEIGRKFTSMEGFEKLRVYRNPRNYGYGGNQKVGFQYALDMGFDFVILLHGDGQYAPEYIPSLLIPALFEGKHVVFGSRMMIKGGARKGGMPLYKYLGNKVLTKIENLILSMNLSEYHSGYRLYSKNVLSKIPFFLNTDDFHFDTQIIIQCRALGMSICEVSIPTFYGDEICYVNGIKYALNALWSVIEYRLHQLHVLRKNRYLVKLLDEQYTLKKSPYSSHRHIINIIRSGSSVLDVGCGRGLLVDELLKKNVKVTGIDNLQPEEVNPHIRSYLQWDIEDLENITLKEKFDYVIWGDVLEHIRNPERSLRASKRFMKSKGLMILSTANITLWFYRLSLLFGRFNYGDRGILDKTHVHLYTKSSSKALIETAGLKIINCKYSTIPFELVFESRKDRRIIRLLNKFYYMLVNLYPAMFAYQFIYIACEMDYVNKPTARLEDSYVRHSRSNPVRT